METVPKLGISRAPLKKLAVVASLDEAQRSREKKSKLRVSPNFASLHPGYKTKRCGEAAGVSSRADQAGNRSAKSNRRLRNGRSFTKN